MKRNKVVKQGEASRLYFLGHGGAPYLSHLALPITLWYCSVVIVQKLIDQTFHSSLAPYCTYFIAVKASRYVVQYQ